MKIIIVTTENEHMKETGFGLMISCLSMKDALLKKYSDVTIKSCTSEKDLEDVVSLSPDVAVLAVKYIHSDGDQKIWLSKYFEDAGINYTGSSRKVLEFDTDKILAKNHILSKNIKTAKFTTVTSENLYSLAKEAIPYPQFVKPLNAANGNGVDDESVVNNFEELAKKAESLFVLYGNTAISENFLSGREFTVAILHNAAKNEYITAPIEIVPELNTDNIRILGQVAKLADDEDMRPITNKLEKEKLVTMAVNCFKAFGARDYGRVDIKMDEHGFCNFLEVNLVPGMTKNTSYFPNCFEIDNKYEYSEVMSLVIENAVNRSSSKIIEIN